MVFDNKFQQIIVKVICVLRSHTHTYTMVYMSMPCMCIRVRVCALTMFMSYNSSHETFARKFSYFIEHMLLISISRMAFLPLIQPSSSSPVVAPVSSFSTLFIPPPLSHTLYPCNYFASVSCDIVLCVMTFAELKNILMSKKVAYALPHRNMAR